MHKQTHTPDDLPTLDQLAAERKRVRYRRRYNRTLRSTVAVLIVVAALAVLIATFWMPVLRIYGASMRPTLEDGQIIVTIKTDHLKPGDIAAFYEGNKLLVKRCIAGPGDVVDLAEDGTVSVNGAALDEPYVLEKARGETDIDLPFTVPENRYFMIGDDRSGSIDSRNTAVGCVSPEQIVGRVVFRVWPLQAFGPVR